MNNQIYMYGALTAHFYTSNIQNFPICIFQYAYMHTKTKCMYNVHLSLKSEILLMNCTCKCTMSYTL